MTEIDCSKVSSLPELTRWLRQSSSHTTSTLSIAANDSPWISLDTDFEKPEHFTEYCQELKVHGENIANVTIRIPKSGCSRRRLRLIGAALCYLPRVDTLTVHLDSNMDHECSLQWILSLFCCCSSCSSLQTLKIHCNFASQTFHDAQVERMCECIPEHRLSLLRHFVLTGYRVHSHQRLLETLTERCPNLQRVSLSGCVTSYIGGGEQCCRALARLVCLPFLRELEFSHLVWLPLHCASLAQALMQSQLQSLSLNACRFHVDGLQSLATGLTQCRTLTCLAIASAQCYETTTLNCQDCLILQDLPPNLQSLKLTKVPLHHEACQSWTGLSQLQLEACDLLSSSPSSLCLSQVLQQNPSLTTLSFKDMMITLQDKHKDNVGLALPKQLRHLVLAGCGLTDANLLPAAVFSQMPPALKTLDVSRNPGMSAADVVQLLQAAQCCQKLYRLDVSETATLSTTRDHQTVLQTLTANPWLCQLRVDVNDDSKTTQTRIAILERLNEAGRCYLREQPTSHEMVLQVLGRVADSLEDVWTHIVENPALVLAALRPLASSCWQSGIDI